MMAPDPDDIRIATGMVRLQLDLPPGMERPALLGLDRAIWMTSGAQALPRNVVTIALLRHAHGDFGVVHPDDGPMFTQHYASGAGILHSAYPIDPALPCSGYGDNTLWIWTESDHMTTTIMLPEEY